MDRITEAGYNGKREVKSLRPFTQFHEQTPTFGYNGLGLPESESTALYDLDAKTTTYTYDGSGNVLTRTHNGETVTYTHDGLGRIKTIDKGQDRIVNYHYIGSGTKVIGYPEADSQWEGYYDTLGRIDRCRSIGPDSETLLHLMYTYDENSNRDSVKYNHLAVPVWDIYTYDNLQRLIQADYGSATGLASLGDYTGDVRFAAGVASKWLASDEPFAELAQLQVRDVRQQQRLVHAAIIKAGLDTVVKEHNNGEMPVVTLVEFGEEEAAGQSTYEMIRNNSGELIGIVITDSNGRITLFTLYPAAGGTLIISISYDASGNEASKVFSSYDEDGSLVEQVDMLAYESRLAGTTTQTTSITSQPVSLQEDLLDDGGSMMMMSMPEGPQAATEGFAYDHLGNRYQVAAKDGFTYTYTHNLNNQYTHIHGEYVWGLTEDAYPEYDDNGNLQTDKWGRQYSYDYRNRLTKVENAEMETVAEYGYDALSRRIKKAAGGKTTYYYYDASGRVIAEYEKPDGGDEAFARSFVYGNGIDEVLAMFLPEKSFDPNDVVELSAFCEDWLTSNATYDYDSSGVVDFNDFAVLADDSWSLPTAKETHFYYLKDALGSVVGIVGGRFQRADDREFYVYDVYGKPSDSSLPSAVANPYLFVGYRFDTGLYHTPYRTYDAEAGRWLQPDPIGHADSMNLYEYVLSNPTNWVDPWGLWTYGGMYDAFWRKYGQEGEKLLLFADEFKYVPVKRDYWLHDWYYEADGTLGIASKWSYWGLSPRIWDDSNETAARQLYAALKSRYGRIGGKVAACLCKLTPTYHWAQQAADDPDFFDAPDFQALGGDAFGMEARASMLGSHIQNEAVAEAQWWLAAAIGGHMAGKAIDALDDCLDARRLAKAADKAADARRFGNIAGNAADEAADAAKGAYSNLSDHPSVGPGKPFTQAQKRKILEQNRIRNQGVVRSDRSGTPVVEPVRHRKGVAPPINEAQIDHIIPKSRGGSNSYSNAQVLTRQENLIKGAKQ